MIDIRRFVMAFEAAIEQAVSQKSAQLGKGQCASFEEYKGRVGEIRGLEAARGLARDMLRKMEIAEDEDDLDKQGAA